jgi:hypothetical protein
VETAGPFAGAPVEADVAGMQRVLDGSLVSSGAGRGQERRPRTMGVTEVGEAGLPGWYVPAVCKAAGVLLAHHSVHEPVDYLCKKSASLWAREEMLGIAAASRDRARAFTWEKTFTPCAQREK